MKILYLDCSMGAAGDMLSAALLELFDNPAQIVEELNSLGVPHVKYMAVPSQKCGITGTHLQVLIKGREEDEHAHQHHRHHRSGLEKVAQRVERIRISQTLKDRILAIYNIIAQAESRVHGEPVSEVHFHEVGSADAIADVTAVCYLLDKLGVEEVYASPVHVGSGQVKCAHGVLPVPAPATAQILQGIPIYGGSIKGELCTPTGAALLKYYVNRFGDMPPMTLTATGYGMGKKDFELPNCVRAMLGAAADETDDVLELSCNLDDMTPEAIGFATEQLLDAGALDVYTCPIGMKKNRPGVLLSVLCKPCGKDSLLPLIFRHTTTLGIRCNRLQRYTLRRETRLVDTPHGQVRQKIATGYGVERSKYEYEDLARIAKEKNIPIDSIL